MVKPFTWITLIIIVIIIVLATGPLKKFFEHAIILTGGSLALFLGLIIGAGIIILIVATIAKGKLKMMLARADAEIIKETAMRHAAIEKRKIIQNLG